MTFWFFFTIDYLISISSLANKLNIRGMDDWYSISAKAVIEHGGTGLLQQYVPSLVFHHQIDLSLTPSIISPLHFPSLLSIFFLLMIVHSRYKTVPQLLAQAFPDHKWIPWLFKSFQGTWDTEENRIGFVLYLILLILLLNWLLFFYLWVSLRYLANKLGKKDMDAWYTLSMKDFRNHGGRALIDMYKGSPQALLTSLFPSHRYALPYFSLSLSSFFPFYLAYWFLLQVGTVEI